MSSQTTTLGAGVQHHSNGSNHSNRWLKRLATRKQTQQKKRSLRHGRLRRQNAPRHSWRETRIMQAHVRRSFDRLPPIASHFIIPRLPHVLHQAWGEGGRPLPIHTEAVEKENGPHTNTHTRISPLWFEVTRSDIPLCPFSTRDHSPTGRWRKIERQRDREREKALEKESNKS